MKVALLANLEQNAPVWPDMPPNQWDHLVTWDTIKAMTAAMKKDGHEVIFLEGDQSLFNNLLAVKPDICFNLCQGHFGETRRVQIPALLQMLQIPYTGSRSFSLAVDYGMMKRILTYHDLPTPSFQVIERIDELDNLDLFFPVQIAPSQIEVSETTNRPHIGEDKDQLAQYLEHFFEKEQQPALIEQVIEGPEIVIGIVGNVPLPRARRLPKNYSNDMMLQGLHLFPPLTVSTTLGKRKSVVDDTYQPFTTLDVVDLAYLGEPLIQQMKYLAAAAFRIIGCLDFAVVKIKLDVRDANKPYITGVEPLPDLDPETSLLWQAAAAEGWSYKEVINRILNETMQRYWLEASANQTNTEAYYSMTKPLAI